MRSRLVVALFASFVALFVVLATFDNPAEARPKPKRSKGGEFEANKGFGLGILVGVPTGLSGKYYLSKDTALDFAIGSYYRYSDGGINFHADFLWHPFLLSKTESLWIPFYLGLGARVLDHGRDRNDRDRDVHLGLRAPIGIALDFNNIPIDIFVELALVLDAISDNNHRLADFNLAFGFRYYFN